MAEFLPPQRRAATSLLAALAIVAVTAAANAQGRLLAHYTISMTGITIGQIIWLVDIGEQDFIRHRRAARQAACSACW